MSFESLPSFGSVFGEEYLFQTRTHVKDEKLCFNSYNSGKWTTRVSVKHITTLKSSDP